jgi:hypothetical protein
MKNDQLLVQSAKMEISVPMCPSMFINGITEQSTQQMINEPILKCLIFELFYFHPTTCFNLQRPLSGGLRIHTSLLNYQNRSSFIN